MRLFPATFLRGRLRATMGRAERKEKRRCVLVATKPLGVEYLVPSVIMRPRHGMTSTRVHNIWLGILDRCKNDRAGYYGKRGIQVCDRWRSFDAFYADMGEPPSSQHSIDRIDVNGHYEPGNCRWATRIEQARNTRANTRLRFMGQELTIAEWSERTGIKPSTICVRLASGWSVERALSSPVRLIRIGAPWKAMGMSRSAWYRARLRPIP